MSKKSKKRRVERRAGHGSFAPKIRCERCDRVERLRSSGCPDPLSCPDCGHLFARYV